MLTPLTCPHCGAGVELFQDDDGKTCPCPSCGKNVDLPRLTTPPESVTSSTRPPIRRLSFIIGLLLLGLPFVGFFPYRWVFHYAADSIVTPDIGERRQAIELGICFVLTFFPAAALSFLIAFFFLVRNWRRSRLAKWLSVCAAGLCTATGGLVLLLVFG